MGTCWPERGGLEVREEPGVRVVGCREELCFFKEAQTPMRPGLPPVPAAELPSAPLGSQRG